jgi:hypothetical protein
MHMVRHNLQLHDLGTALSRDLANDLLQPKIDAADKRITPILGTPDHVVRAVECDVVVRSHADYIGRSRIIFKLRPISAEQGPRSTGERLSFPMPEGRGMPAISLKQWSSARRGECGDGPGPSCTTLATAI